VTTGLPRVKGILAHALLIGGAAAVLQVNPEPARAQQPSAPTTESPDLEVLYDRGVPFSEFLQSADQRRDAWHANYARGVVPGPLLDRMRSIQGQWRMLVVAEDWCGDSANTIPYVARLVEAVEGLEMRVINSEAGRAVMESHPTPDGRPATPTIVLMDAMGGEIGCFVERPASLQSWFLANEEGLPERELYDRKYAWYDQDRGEETVTEIVGILEAAAAGATRCDTGADKRR
jgi:hypothetical protein